MVVKFHNYGLIYTILELLLKKHGVKTAVNADFLAKLTQWLFKTSQGIIGKSKQEI